MLATMRLIFTTLLLGCAAACGATESGAPHDGTGGETSGPRASGGEPAVPSGAGGMPAGTGGAASGGGHGTLDQDCDQIVGEDAPTAVNETAIKNGMGGAASLHENAVCGCNGNAYEFVELIEGGLDPYHYCLVPAGQFGCGEGACTLGEEYCAGLADHSNTSVIQSHDCVSIPDECAGEESLCDCLSADPQCREVEVEGQTATYVLNIIPH